MQERPSASIISWLTDHPRPVEEEGVRVYRLRRSYLALGIGATLFLASVGVVSVLAAWWNVDGYPRTLAVAFGIGWGGFTRLGSYLILCYYRERLFVDDVGVLKQDCFTRRWLKFSDVTSAQWRGGSTGASLDGPSILLRDPRTKIVVRLNQFANGNDLRELIQHFRQSIDPQAQQDWETFESRILVDPSGLIAWRGEAWVGMMFLIFAVGSLVDSARRGNLTVAAMYLVIGSALTAHALRRKNRAAHRTRGD